VSSLDDVKALKAAGLSGAIIGKALFEGRVKLDEALSC
jgi:phosphoribosylformimino-5-aminoimidazole carboxamide ribotide isomerase